MPSFEDKNLGPFPKVTPTDRIGRAFDDDNPLRVKEQTEELVKQSLRADTNTQILAELRTLTRVTAIGMNVPDHDVEAIRADEMARAAS